ncbi:class D sortase [Bacillus shivajii]|uniref:class D sortase n=1 Tax=Bacillus shivajii TaxID=1983719 RepID=UPI001CFAB5EE|nr:class D sortase [Bacillus shivajii]UCZ53177.1 class D sortase [Bacillus shivajii]
MKILGLLLLLSGGMIFSYNGYTWLEQRNSVVDLSMQSNTHAMDYQLVEKESSTNIEKSEPENIPLLEEGSQIAELTIPKLERLYPVYWGTESTSLKKGVGMYDSQWTVTPDIVGHTVLSGHRDTVFRDVGDLVEGDQLHLKFEGTNYIYEIVDIWITDKNDRTVIVNKDSSILTLTTCYPFNYLGNAPERYIIQSELIRKEKNS